MAPLLPANCKTDWNDVRYVGYQNVIGINCHFTGGGGAMVVVDDTGAVIHTFTGPGNVFGHYDFSPAGHFAWSRKPQNNKETLDIYIANIDGSGQRVILSVPFSQARYVSNMHVSWPDRVADWFIVSFFPHPTNLPASYAPLLDEILKIDLSGATELLARTGTLPGGDFWAQVQASPSADGSRISFNSNCAPANVATKCVSTGTIDQYILFMDVSPLVQNQN